MANRRNCPGAGSHMVHAIDMLESLPILEGDEALDYERPKSRELTDRQRQFIAAYVANGRNARQAAIAAGTSPTSAAQMGYRNIRNPVILDAIRHAAGDMIKERLPELIEAMVELALDTKVSAVARVSAFRELADRGGMAVNRGPLIQINNGMTDPKAQAQALIAEIWTEKNTREARKERTHAYVAQLVDARKSGIDGAMADIIDNDRAFAALGTEVPGTGGDRCQGPIAGANVIPPSPNGNAATALVSALLEWRGCVSRWTGGNVGMLEEVGYTG